MGQEFKKRSCRPLALPIDFFALCPTWTSWSLLCLTPPHRPLRVGMGRPLVLRILTLNPLPFFTTPIPSSLGGGTAPYPESLACHGQCPVVSSASFWWGQRFLGGREHHSHQDFRDG